jgi:hypothetical protein
MCSAEHEGLSVHDDEAGIKEILGLFDVPAFARRGRDLEEAIGRLDGRLAHERFALLEMARVRLKQWAAVSTDAGDWSDVFERPVDGLYTQCGAEPPEWSAEPASLRRRQTVARDLVASLARFNQRWIHRVDQVKLDAINAQIDMYNRYYILEKECVLGSSKLASRYFVPRPLLSRERIMMVHPTLSLPELRK